MISRHFTILFVLWSLMIAACALLFFGFQLHLIALLIAWFGGVDFTLLVIAFRARRRIKEDELLT